MADASDAGAAAGAEHVVDGAADVEEVSVDVDAPPALSRDEEAGAAAAGEPPAGEAGGGGDGAADDAAAAALPAPVASVAKLVHVEEATVSELVEQGKGLLDELGEEHGELLTASSTVLSDLRQEEQLVELSTRVTGLLEGGKTVLDGMLSTEEMEQLQGLSKALLTRLAATSTVEEVSARATGLRDKMLADGDVDGAVKAGSGKLAEQAKAVIHSDALKAALIKGRAVLAEYGQREDAKELLAAAKSALPKLQAGAHGLLDSGEEALGKLAEDDADRRKLLRWGLDVVSTHGDTLAEKLESVDAKAILDAGEAAIRDEEARAQLVEKVTDRSLEFLLRYLPEIKVPPISGVKDEVAYAISNLDLADFTLNKEDVTVQLHDLRLTGEILTVRVENIRADMRALQWSYAQNYFPYLNGKGVADAKVVGGAVELGFKLERLRRRHADGRLTDAEPTLLLSSKAVQVSELQLTVEGSWFSWVYNLLANLFKDIVRRYLITTLGDALEDNLSTLLRQLNGYVRAYMPTVLSLSGIEVDALPEREVDPDEGSQVIAIEGFPGEYRIHFYGHEPIGIVLAASPAGAAGASAHPYVASLSRDTDAGSAGVTLAAAGAGAGDGDSKEDDDDGEEGKAAAGDGEDEDAPPTAEEVAAAAASVAKATLGKLTATEKKKAVLAESVEELQLGHLLLEVEGKSVAGQPLKAVQRRLDRKKRPLVVRMRVAALPERKADKALHITSLPFAAGPMGLLLKPLAAGSGAYISGFKARKDGSPGQAEQMGKLHKGMVLLRVAGSAVPALPFRDIVDKLRDAARPVLLDFAPACDVHASLSGWPLGLQLELLNGFFVVTGFDRYSGPAEEHADIALNDDLVAVGGMDTAGVPYGDVIARLRALPRPIQLSFRGTDGVTKDVSFGAGPIGLVLDKRMDTGGPFAKAWSSFKGPAEKAGCIYPGLVLLSINGTPVEGATSVEDVQRMLEEADEPRQLLLRDMARMQRYLNLE